MGLRERLNKYRKPKQEPEPAKEQVEEKTIPEIEDETRQRIKSFLYDDTLVEEFLPMFMKLQEMEGAEQFYELLEAKETELNNVFEAQDSFKQETDPEHKQELPNTEEQEASTDYVMQIMNEKYGE